MGSQMVTYKIPQIVKTFALFAVPVQGAEGLARRAATHVDRSCDDFACLPTFRENRPNCAQGDRWSLKCWTYNNVMKVSQRDVQAGLAELIKHGPRRAQLCSASIAIRNIYNHNCAMRLEMWRCANFHEHAKLTINSMDQILKSKSRSG